ncbi:unnamed protein product [Acanthoscelides obtectus]|nr:unnamed protein product [Acanthoscelides obtectus]CAK1672839.1 Nucleolar complex protein 3 homolog [Acanthoscelides obtectus]
MSKTKKNNIKRTKLIKRGVIRASKKPQKKFKEAPVAAPKKRPVETIEEEESDHGEDMLGMVEEDDLEFLKQSITNRSYNIFNRIRYSVDISPKQKKQKTEDVNNDDALENEYQQNLDNTQTKKIKSLLPIKTKDGIVRQAVEETDDGDNQEEADEEVNFESIEEDHSEDFSKPVSATQLLIRRNEIIREKKLQVGNLCATLLENPEEKITNLRTLLTIMNEDLKEAYFTVRKFTMLSILEVFKDILPSYEIKKTINEGVKLKKDTLKLHKYEESLLMYYKQFLKKLEKHLFVLIKKKGDFRKKSGDEIKLGILAVEAMLDLLVTHPYFNFSENIGRVVVPFLTSYDKGIRKNAKEKVIQLFKEDKKGDITFTILRIINNYLKTHSNVHSDMLEVLLVLNLKNVNLDQQKEQDLKQKKLMAKKARVQQLSKKERKRKKKLAELDKELLETKAEENRQTKEKNVTEITKILFNIYFRILKTSKNNKLLGACLQGLAKYSHCINLEYYLDIVNIIDHLLKEEWLTYVEQLHCVQTVFAILSGQGEVINLDPTRFYNNLYQELLSINAASKRSDYICDFIKTLNDALIKRRKKITNKRLLGFVKRLSILSLQVSHDGALACLGLIRNIMQLNRSLDILLDLDPSIGEGQYQAEIDDPEYSNAASTALYEIIALSNHYHPVVRMFARNIASGVPATGNGSLPGEYAKTTPDQLYEDFNMSDMAFNPPVCPPKSANVKSKPTRHYFVDSAFQEECMGILNISKQRHSFFI